jgi:galactokinase
MSYQLKIPARINILGNPSDANEGDFATISMATDLFAYAYIEPADHIRLEQLKKSKTGWEMLLSQEYAMADLPLPYDDQLDLIKAAVNRLWQYSPEFRRKLNRHGFKLKTWTEVPRQSGLGGSTLFVLLALGALRALYNLDPLTLNDYVLSELTQRAEALELGIACGFADRYVPLFGGIAYLDYRGKLLQKPLGEEPFVTYERLDSWVEQIPLVAVSSGIPHNSGDVHGCMRPRYIEESKAWTGNGSTPPPMVQFMSGAYETAWRGKIALLHRDWPRFGTLMNENHRWVDQMMNYCGFQEGAGWANNLLIEVALQNGALGAKLTGAGGGGSVFALVNPGEEMKVISAWEQCIGNAGLTEAEIYRPQIAQQGLIIEEIREVPRAAWVR